MTRDALFKPWLAPLLRNRAMCRALLVVCAVMGFGAFMGWRLWPCVFAEVTGLPCPGCGMTRATAAMLKGDWTAALRFHPFVPFFGVIGIVIAFGALFPPGWVAALASRLEIWERQSRLTGIFLTALLCFGLLRMLGFWYQPPISGPSGLFFKRTAPTGQTNTAPNIQPK